MKLQNLTVIFIAIMLPIILMVSFYISTGLKTITYQSIYDTGLLTATHDSIYAFELNTTNDAYSDNAETKRTILKSSVKAFEKGLAKTCGISEYNADEIEKYIPAIVFGMYDGFYMYAPSALYNATTNEYEYKHGLKNYVYYSEELDDEGTVIRYSLDNYVVVSGDFGSGYETKEGYLIIEGNWEIDTNDEGAKNYKNDATTFTSWFNTHMPDKSYLKIDSSNDPEDENSKFVQHKRQVIKNKMESVLNSSITAYSEKIMGQNYKMPKFSEEDWEKVYSDISMITLFQGKSIGLTKYNGYCVLNSSNHNEYANPNLIYFIDADGMYHDIRCKECGSASSLDGHKIGYFKKKKIEETRKDESGNEVVDTNGDPIIDTKYVYNTDALACYECINKGSFDTPTSVYEYIKEYANNKVKKAYYTALARERYNTVKLLSQ